MGLKYNISPGPVDFLKYTEQTQTDAAVTHRSEHFYHLYSKLKLKIKELIEAPLNAEVVFPCCSGTGALELLMSGLLKPGDKILIFANGFFGERLFRMAEALNLEPYGLRQTWDKPLDVNTIRQFMDSGTFDPQTKAVFMVHVETSTGLINDLEAISDIIKTKKLYFFVDAISSVGSNDVRMEAWGIDGLVTVSYKGLLSPPCLSILVLSDRCMVLLEQQSNPTSYYFDLKKMIKCSKDNTTATTVPVNIFQYLNRVLTVIHLKGKLNYYNECRQFADYFRTQLLTIGFKIYGERYHSTGVTGIDISDITAPLKSNIPALLEDKCNIFVGGGLGILKDKIFRIGHYAPINKTDCEFILSCFDVFFKEIINQKMQIVR